MSKEPAEASNSLVTKARKLRARGMSRGQTARKLGVHHAVVRAIDNKTIKIQENEDKNSQGR